MGKGGAAAAEEEGGGATANNVYIRSDEFAWVPARLVEQGKEDAKVAIPQYEAEEFIASDGGAGAIGFKSAVVKLKDYPGRMLPLQNCGKDGTLTEVDDMVDLPYLHEVSCVVLRCVLNGVEMSRYLCGGSGMMTTWHSRIHSCMLLLVGFIGLHISGFGL
jgi:hypothetical protein